MRMTTMVMMGLSALTPTLGMGATVPVGPGASIQQAIDAAIDGDTIAVAAGIYQENLDFEGKAIAVVGVGPETVVQGTGTGSVVRFVSGEDRRSTLDSVTITGGAATNGGGIFIANSSPTILRTVITRNQATNGGSAVFIDGSSGPAAPELRNNLVTFNTTSGGDPHVVQIRNATPLVVNNTIYGGDSNGIHLSGASAASVIMNNVIAMNGSRIAGQRRGRGICDFSGAIIRYNVFWANHIGALLTAGSDFRRIRTAERILGRTGLSHNSDRTPAFVTRRRPHTPLDFRLRPASPVRDNGNPDPAFDDRDGSRNDPGYTGGPLASPGGS